MSWFVRGDIDGFFGLAIDNIVQLLVINGLCRFVLGFDDHLLYARVMPGVAVSLLIGNFYYAWQAKKLGDRLGRNDVCALPYGINTPSVIAYIFLVMLPARNLALSQGLDGAAAATVAWHAGLIACLGSGVIELAGSFVAERIRRATPRAALLSTLAGIALTFISINFLFRTFAHPVVGIVTLGIILLGYFGGVRFKFGLPTGLVAVAIGVALSWATGIAPVGDPPGPISFHLPIPVFGDLVEAFSSNYLMTYISIIIPMGVFNVIGSLQNIESAEAGNDQFKTAPSLAANGIGSIAAACFGSCFPTTIYIGHPGWKAMGARAGYSLLNGAVITVLCLTGAVAHLNRVVPVEAGMAIVLWIGIIITAQAFSATPKKHAPAAVIGLLPGVAAWGAITIKNTLRITGYGAPDGPDMSQEGASLIQAFNGIDTWLDGAFALEQGFIFSAMILAAMTVMIIERRFIAAGAWSLVAAGLCLVGFMHSYTWTSSDTVIHFTPAFKWALAYAITAVILFATPWLTTPAPETETEAAD
jgi:AGZA family xanthine/uracil permease-like MFS transporter